MKRQVGAGVAAALLAATLLLAGHRPHRPAHSAATARTVVAATNRARAARHLRHLTFSPRLSASSAAWSAHIAGLGRLVHDEFHPTGPHGWRGEVLLWNPGLPTARMVVRTWLSSPPHRRVLLARRPVRMGAGAVRRHGRTYWTARLAAP